MFLISSIGIRMTRAQTNQMFIYAIAIILAGALIFFGVSAISKVRQTSCDTGLTTFKDTIDSLALEAGAKRASGVGETIRTPCGVDKVLFFDRSKDVVFDGFDEFPAIQNTLNADTDKNTFLIKDGEVMDALQLDNLDIKAPYFLCSDTDNGNIKLLVKSDFDGETTLWPMDELSDCTYEYTTSLKLSSDDTLFMLETLFEEDEDILGKSVVDPLAVGLARNIEYEAGETRVTVKKKRGSFGYYEYVPPCAIKDFSDVTNGVGFSSDTSFSDTFPESRILEWTFSGGAESITYVFASIVSPDCLRGHSPGLFGLALGADTYPGIAPSHIQMAQETRKKQGLRPFENLDSTVFDHISSRYKGSQIDVKEELDTLYSAVLQSNLSQVDKSYLVRRVNRIRESLHKEPGTIGPQLDYIINTMDDEGVNVTEHVNAALISHYGSRKHAYERHRTEVISQADPGCSISGSHCYDGSNISNRCIDEGHIRRVDCQNGKCVYNPVQVCTGMCVDGRCLAPNNCYDERSTCIDVSGNHYHDYCEDRYTLVEYECSGSSCNDTRKDCHGMGAICIHGECVMNSVVGCTVEDDEGFQKCIETFRDGSTKELNQTCYVSDDGEVITIAGVDCDGNDRCGYTSMESQWKGSCSCQPSGEVVC